MTNQLGLLRRAAKLSKPELAERMGVSERTVYRWETGATEIPDHQKLALASLFNVSVMFLIGHVPDPDDLGVTR